MAEAACSFKINSEPANCSVGILTNAEAEIQ